ncbi:esterase family protein [Paenibacillus kandeliae]|uniref:esterase family protein n=1 Tax=Paenibacillus kandeliae TaxID=3231269 RepID=UPI0034588561
MVTVQYRKEYSSALGRDMEYKVYGDRGKPMLVFPTSLGRFYQYEDSGMIDELAPWIDAGKLQVWACDSIDEETFFSSHWNVEDRMNRHEQYNAYIVHELIPHILWESQHNNHGHEQKILISGCSMGAYYSGNFFFRHPHFFDTLLAFSGVYSVQHFFGDHRLGAAYYNSPLDYLPGLHEEHLLNQYRSSRIILCCGQGAWEDEMRYETGRMQHILEQKQIPARVEFWGHDVDHDWYWWRQQLRYYMSSLM